MRVVKSWLVVVAAALLLGSSVMPAATRASGMRRVDAASVSPQALYTQTLQHLAAVGRVAFSDTVTVLLPAPSTVRYSFRYAAPDRMAGTLVSTPAQGKTVSLETIQVGGIKCQRPPSWVCFRSRRVDLAGLVRSLITPPRAGLTFRSATALAGSPGQRDPVVQLLATGGLQNVSYRATLTVNATTGLPLAFANVVTSAGHVEARQSVAFSYDCTCTIQLPQGKGVSLPSS